MAQKWLAGAQTRVQWVHLTCAKVARPPTTPLPTTGRASYLWRHTEVGFWAIGLSLCPKSSAWSSSPRGDSSESCEKCPHSGTVTGESAKYTECVCLSAIDAYCGITPCATALPLHDAASRVGATGKEANRGWMGTTAEALKHDEAHPDYQGWSTCRR